VLLVGPYQRRLRTLYEAEAQRQQLLAESIHDMRTIKSIAMEPVQCRQWDDRSAANFAGTLLHAYLIVTIISASAWLWSGGSRDPGKGNEEHAGQHLEQLNDAGDHIRQ
jgi:ABC-type bacteriocin/lantibiotic exporter with double-glycine peptidase domain